jgi:hypothetical protein
MAMTEINSLGDIMRRLPSEHHGRRFLERLIWPSGRVCPHCGGFESGAIKQGKKGEEGKKGKARPGLYQCRHRECRGQFTVTTCTPMRSASAGARWSKRAGKRLSRNSARSGRRGSGACNCDPGVTGAKLRAAAGP